jgi:hypothetical protein
MGWTEGCKHCPRVFPTCRSKNSHEANCKWKSRCTEEGPEEDGQWTVQSIVEATGPPFSQEEPEIDANSFSGRCSWCTRSTRHSMNQRNYVRRSV